MPTSIGTTQMNWMSDQRYMLDKQYKDADNFHARAALHARFGTNEYPWPRWVFDHFDLPADGRILELGCGPALLWRNNLDRIPVEWNITLSDFSPGMVQEARQYLSGNEHPFAFEQIDIQSISFPDDSFDAVVANHMLYHVPDREKGIAEVRRVLKPGGYFYAATNGEPHLRELFEWMKKIAPDCLGKDPPSTRGFALENGAEQLSRSFAEVEMDRYEEDLKVTEAEPFVAYVASTDRLNDDQLATLAEQVAAKIERCGTIHITKSQGLFISF
jgi:ubiquinone/menaquinone biosynthesis C-methylase UbiE